VRHWLEALGDDEPRYLAEGVAPPAMIQVWTMRGLRTPPDPADPLQAASAVLDAAGYTSVVATNCEQTYHRPLRVGELLRVTTRLIDLAGPKRTALGEGWFVTTRSTWLVDGPGGPEPVAEMLFRVLKFRPPEAGAGQPPGPAAAGAAGAAQAAALRPVVTEDTAFFWAGTAVGELRIQRCARCGRLRHPPGPGCPACGELQPADPRYVVSSGAGRLHSFVVHHHPPVPGRRLPIVIGLVDLADGVRMVGELVDVAAGAVRIGMDVELALVRVGPTDRRHGEVEPEDLVLPAWRPVPSPGPGPGAVLPPLRLDVTPTFVISTALATRDFQDVHHDRDRARLRGSPDIFVNILTTTGLVQSYLTRWAPTAVVRGVAVRLGVPCHPGDRLTFTGHVSRWDEATGSGTVAVTGTVARGDHVTGTVEFQLPGAAGADAGRQP
ncbi:MAG TPA: OB-fold domain-containing protein, partial [Kineosporiaceae bacterium]